MSVGDLDSNPFSMAPDGRFTLSASVENDVTYCGSRVSGLGLGLGLESELGLGR